MKVYDMKKPTNISYSKTKIEKVGYKLSKEIKYTLENKDDVNELFRIGHAWRMAHHEPMKIVLRHTRLLMRKQKLVGPAVGRIKSMDSIRKKLRRYRLNQIQDIGGCRCILPTISETNQLINYFRDHTKFEIISDDNYIYRPKLDGYRCYHYILKCSGKEAHQKDLRIELQIRSRLQHSWATAVEAMGLFLGQDFKGGNGDKNWLELFKLMSIELARAENCTSKSLEEIRPIRIERIKALGSQLNAVNTLDNLTHAFNYTDVYEKDPKFKPKYYLIKYDKINQKVRVQPYYNTGSEFEMNKGNFTEILVEADKIETLKDAFPNYFGDVQLFKRNLRSIILEKQAKEYSLPPQESAAPLPREYPDLAWMRTAGRIRHRTNKVKFKSEDIDPNKPKQNK